MDLQEALRHRDRVEAFRRKHRIGVLTLLFTDIAASTRLKQQYGDAEAVDLIHQHHATLRELLALFTEGEEISTAGDSFFLVFAKPSEAVEFALLAQARVRALAKSSGKPLADRIGIHVGEVFITESDKTGKDLYGIQVDLTARIMRLAQPGQILMSRFAFDNARRALREPRVAGLNKLSWLNHGPYLIAGVDETLEVCEVGEVGQAALTAPTDTAQARRHAAPEGEPVLGWRPAGGQIIPGTEWILHEKLGEGGFGEVWLGDHQRLKDRRVFKFCFRADRVRALKRELTLFRILREAIGEHPNIVGVHDVYLEHPPYYLVMDLAAGKDLRAWCDEQGGVEKVPVQVRIEIVAQIADALQAAHQAGIIHRDVKPSNIIVTSAAVRSASNLTPPAQAQEVQARLTDFGIGQVVSSEALAGVTRLGFTQTMLAPGTPQPGTHLYMAPEALAGKPPSTRSDIYSVGVVLYQLLTGDFSRPVTMDWNQAIEDPLLREDLTRCFAGDPALRFSGAGQLAERLRALDSRRAALAKQQAEAAAREQAAYRRGMLRTVTVAAVIVASFAAVAFYALQQARRATEQAELARQEAHRAQRATEAAQAADALAQRQSERAKDLGKQREEAESVRLLHEANQWWIQKNETTTALAFLARTLRNNSNDSRAAFRLISLLNEMDPARPIKELRLRDHVFDAVATRDGFLLSGIDSASNLFLHNVSRDTREVLGPVPNLDTACKVSFSPSGRKYLVALDRARLLRAVDRSGDALRASALAHTGPVGSFAFNRDESLLATLERLPLPGSADRTNQLRLLPPQPSRAVADPHTNLLRVWRLPAGEVIKGPAAVPFDGIIGFGIADRFVKLTRYERNGSPSVPGALGRHVRGDFDIGTGRVYDEPTSPFAGSDFEWVDRGGRKPLHWRLDTRRVPDRPKLYHDLEECSADGTEYLRVCQGLHGSFFSLPLSDRASSSDAIVKLWDVRRRDLTPLLLSAGEIIAWNEKWVVDKVRGRYRIRDSETMRVAREVPFEEASPQGPLGLSRDGRRLAVLSNGGTLTIWDANSGRILKNLELTQLVSAKEPSGVNWKDATFAGDLNRCLVPVWRAAGKRGLRLLDIDRGLVVCDLEVPGRHFVWRLPYASGDSGSSSRDSFYRVSPDGNTVLAQSSGEESAEDGSTQFHLWRAADGRPIGTSLDETNKVESCVFSPGGDRLATASGELVKVWDIQAEGLTASLTLKHEEDVRSLLFSDTSKLLATQTSYGHPVTIWDARTGRQVSKAPYSKALFSEKSASCRPVDFSPDDALILLEGDNGESHVCEVHSGELLATVRSGSKGVFGWKVRRFVQGGRAVVSAGQPGATFLHLPEIEGPVPVWLAALVEALIGCRMSEQGLLEPVSPNEFTRHQQFCETLAGTNVYERWAKWFLGDPLQRAPSPATVLASWDVASECLLSENDEWLELALRLRPEDKVVVETCLERYWAHRWPGDFSSSADDAVDRVLRLNRTLNATNALSADHRKLEAWASLRTGNAEAALRALAHIDPEPAETAYWLLKASILERLKRTADAEYAYGRAVEPTIRGAEFNGLAFQMRARFLRGQDRAFEAGQDTCRAHQIPVRDKPEPLRLIDLSAAYTHPLNATFPRFGHLLGSPPFSKLPQGVHQFASTEFDVRGMVALSSGEPKTVKVGLKARRVHFLHARNTSTDFDSFLRPSAAKDEEGDQAVACYFLEYEGGETREVLVRHGQHLSDWMLNDNKESRTTDAVCAWTDELEAPRGLSNQPRTTKAALYKMTWENPLPDVVVDRIRLVPSRSKQEGPSERQTRYSVLVFGITIDP